MRKDYNKSDLLELVKSTLAHASAFRSCSEQESLSMLSLISLELQKESVPEKIKSQFMYRLIEKRLQLYSYDMSEHAIALISFISPTPGIAVIYMTYLQYVAHKYGIKKYTVGDLCMKAITWGLFKSEVLDRFWDDQKAENAPLTNMVDDIDCINYIANHEEVR